VKVIFKHTNQVKEVAAGYAVNYLIPRGLATVATEQNLQVLEEEKQAQDLRKQTQQAQDKELAVKLAGTKIEIAKKAGEKGKIFGSVTKKEILSQLSESHENIELVLNKPIKKLGKYELELKIGQNRVKINVEIKSDN
jgi:large subunit ribosomal protein L9